jgi:hypothetical protein
MASINCTARTPAAKTEVERDGERLVVILLVVMGSLRERSALLVTFPYLLDLTILIRALLSR